MASVALSVSKLVFNPGRVDLAFLGLSNYQQLLFGLERPHFLGVLKPPTPIGWAILLVTIGLAIVSWVRTARSGRVGWVRLGLRLAGGVLLVGFVGLLVETLASDGGRPGSVVVTCIFVFGGIALQLSLGLGLAMLATQQVPWRRFFRILFLIPLTITPVGVGYMFLMLTDTSKGPLEPLWVALGLRNFTWVTDPWLARFAVIIGDTWQWTPFVFIVLLAALIVLAPFPAAAYIGPGAGAGSGSACRLPRHSASDARGQPAACAAECGRRGQPPARRGCQTRLRHTACDDAGWFRRRCWRSPGATCLAAA